MKYKYSRKEIQKDLTSEVLGNSQSEFVSFETPYFKMVIKKLLATKESKPKEWVCPNCLGRNGCMCALKPKPNKIEPVYKHTTLLDTGYVDIRDITVAIMVIELKLNELIDAYNDLTQKQ